MKKLKVLIVEDDPTAAFTIEKQIKNLGYNVIGITEDYRTTMESIQKELPDLIVMDIFLKGEKNGIETALEIYKRDKILTVFISAPGNALLLEGTKFIKSSVFLSKPFDLEKLHNTIEGLQSEAIKQTPEYIEAERIKALHRYEILNTPEEGNFDRITRIAALTFRVPIALVCIVNKDKIWFNSRYGFNEKQIPKNPELFASAFLSDKFFYTTDIKKDAFALANPILAHNAGFEFYASAPLLTKDGHTLGTLCIIDRIPREITKEEEQLLMELAAIVMDEMELRLDSRRSFKLQREFIKSEVHNLRNPLNSILGLSELLTYKKLDNETNEYTTLINKSAREMLTAVERMMDAAISELANVNLNFTSVNLAEVAQKVVDSNHIPARRKRQSLRLNVTGNPVLKADQVRLWEVLDNLIKNAISFSPEEKFIEINIYEENGMGHIEVKDEGVRLTVQDKSKMFETFSILESQPEVEETTTGLGLFFVKNIVEMHGGKIWAKSEGQNKGSIFEIELPLMN